MPASLRLTVVLAAGVATALALSGCGGGDKGSTGNTSAVAVAVTSTDDDCTVARTDLPAGTHLFQVQNKGNRVTEFYVYGSGDKVVGEVEDISPGVTRELRVQLAAGKYEAACKPGMAGDGIRRTLTVSGTASSSTQAASLQGAGAQYQQYVRAQTADLLTQTQAFVAAVKAGDVARAKALYPVARTPWERIEPVAESFGDLDPLVDGRDGDQQPGQDFTGFHRIEQALWVTGDLSGMGPYADQLLTGVQKIVEKANEVTLEPLQLANGAKGLLDEIASGKITGEEERYSHTDLWDFAGNLDGSEAAIDALRPFLQQTDADLLTQIDQRFAAVQTELAQYRDGDGWLTYDRLNQDQLRGLSDRITALTESVSKVPATVAEG